jgi:hypothetical protein
LHHGFVYLVIADSTIFDNANLQVKVKNIKTEAITTFDFNMAAFKEEAVKRIKKGDQK